MRASPREARGACEREDASATSYQATVWFAVGAGGLSSLALHHTGVSRFVRVVGAVALGATAVLGCGLAGCGSLSESAEAPDIPEDFPQLTVLDSARVDLVVDGEGFEDTGLCRHGATLEAAGVRFSVSVGFFEVSVTGRGIESYSSEAGEVTASWVGPEDYESSPECGESVVRFEGEEPFDGIRGDEVATWGTLQLILCDETGDVLEVSGKFSCAL